MKVEDYFKIIFFKFKNRNKKVMIKKNSNIKKTFLEGKNLFRKNNIIENSEIGFGTYFGNDIKVKCLKIGRYCSIASNLKIISGTHPLESNVSTHPAFYYMKNKELNELELSYVERNKYNEGGLIDDKWSVIIGNDVWIGSDVKILHGVKIGDGAVIGAEALITKDVKPYTIVGGVPAKLIRKRFSDEDIKFLLELKWWDKGEKWIRENAEFFEDINLLKEKLKNK